MTAVESQTAAEAEVRALRDFTARVGGARVRASVARFVVQWVAPWVAASALFVWIAPLIAPYLLPVVGLALAAALLGLVLRERRAVRQSLLLLHARGIALADLVLAWEEAVANGKSNSAMGEWLRADLAVAIGSLPARREQEWLAPRLGPLRYAVPVAVALCLFLWLLPDFELRTPGVAEPPPPPQLAGGGGPGSGDQGPSSVGDEGKGGGGDDTPQSPPEEEPRDPTPPGGSKQEPPEAPAPYLELPTKTEVLVPDLVRDGPTRRAMAHRALVGSEEEGGASAPTASAQGANGDGVPVPRPTQEDFRRAEERARQDRRVPERERAIVRRFFALLQEAGR